MPRVTEITVSAGRTFNHPYEQYSNLKPQVTVRAALGDGEDWREATRALQSEAEMIVEDHKRIVLEQLEVLEGLRTRRREAADLERTTREAQERTTREAQERTIREAQERLRSAADGAPALEGNGEGQELDYDYDGDGGPARSYGRGDRER